MKILTGYNKIIFILIVFSAVAFPLFSGVVIADGQEKEKHDSQHQEFKKYHYDQDDDKPEWIKDDDGNEITGQIALWMLVLANLTVITSIITKGLNRFVPLAEQTKSAVRKINQFQKNHLRRFHYVLNPTAMCIAISHFLLSSCRKTSLPEWGLIFMIIIIFFGLLIKFKTTPISIRKIVYRLHTGSETFFILIILLVVGHIIAD